VSLSVRSCCPSDCGETECPMPGCEARGLGKGTCLASIIFWPERSIRLGQMNQATGPGAVPIVAKQQPSLPARCDAILLALEAASRTLGRARQPGTCSASGRAMGVVRRSRGACHARSTECRRDESRGRRSETNARPCPAYIRLRRQNWSRKTALSRFGADSEPTAASSQSSSFAS
jgi:hypothetical protein